MKFSHTGPIVWRDASRRNISFRDNEYCCLRRLSAKAQNKSWR